MRRPTVRRSPTQVAAHFGVNLRTFFAGSRWTGVAARISSTTQRGRRPPARLPCTALDLPNSVQQEPAATEASVRAMDPRDGPNTDCRALQSEAQPQLGVSIAALARAERTAPAVAGVQQNPEAVKHWLATEYPTIQRRARREGAQIFFADRRVCDRNSTADDVGSARATPWSRARAPSWASI